MYRHLSDVDTVKIFSCFVKITKSTIITAITRGLILSKYLFQIMKRISFVFGGILNPSSFDR